MLCCLQIASFRSIAYLLRLLCCYLCGVVGERQRSKTGRRRPMQTEGRCVLEDWTKQEFCDLPAADVQAAAKPSDMRIAADVHSANETTLWMSTPVSVLGRYGPQRKGQFTHRTWMHWRHQLWGAGVRAPSSSNCLIFFLVTSELHKLLTFDCV